MTRCYLEPDAWVGERLHLSERETHHLIHVRRVRAGAEVEVLDGRGRYARAELQERRRGERAVVRVLDEHRVSRSGLTFALAQCVLKRERFELVVQKCVELGISVLRPVLSERSMMVSDPARQTKAHRRWFDIAVDAAKQSGSRWLPEIRPAVQLADLLAEVSEYEVFLVGLMGPRARELRTVIQAAKLRSPRSVALLIGPEGGFTDEELPAILDAGLEAVSFGARVLRAETAALYGMSVMTYEFEEDRGCRGTG